jgi:RecA-family ATPase
VETVGSLVGPEGTGKTFLTLEAAMSVAAEGVDLFGLGLRGNGTVVMFTAKEPVAFIGKRAHAINKFSLALSESK